MVKGLVRAFCSRILFKGKQNVGAVVTGKRVGDGAGNGFGEQSQVRGCGKKNSRLGLGGGCLFF
ncbi:hypothetical protein NC653_040215 [Populus alba x Populus x berolinensis]|uniref:Uncharacterized protein n=1 Tax=Populus alba x Populus x berolinensis TaxID=444605 RepID=A0AAD6PRJ2_9ROSI|nr:hypothetical protein NC653_040214 [Populus alba x Populus x berolinensis]KAJ6958495.1 hypothetical protein NC653_040215 [Populus alba x Populus x berolinensis]